MQRSTSACLRLWHSAMAKSTPSTNHPSFRADLTLLIRVNTGCCAVSGDQENSWGIKIWIVRGLMLDVVGWLEDWQTGLRGRRVKGLSAPCLGCEADLLSWSPSARRGVNDFPLRLSGVRLTAAEMLRVTVCRRSSRMCWQVLSVCLRLFQLAGRLHVGRSISPLLCTEGHRVRLVRALLSAGALSMQISYVWLCQAASDNVFFLVHLAQKTADLCNWWSPFPRGFSPFNISVRLEYRDTKPRICSSRAACSNLSDLIITQMTQVKSDSNSYSNSVSKDAATTN